MRIFVTGATGFIGSAVVKELLTNGHQVIGLSRTDEGAQRLTNMGVQVHRGDLNDLEGLKKAAASADGVIHLAFNRDFINLDRCVEMDKNAIEAMCSVYEGSNRPIAITSGVMGFKSTGTLPQEDDPRDPEYKRSVNEGILHEYATKGVRTIVIRLPIVHGNNDKGFLIRIAKFGKQHGASFIVDEGKNLWPAVHLLDLAKLYRLAIEKAPAGSNLHGVAEEGIEFRQIAQAIGQQIKAPIKSITRDEIVKDLGFIGHVMSTNLPVSSKKTQELLGWKPNEVGLLVDLARDDYFDRMESN